MRGAEQSFQALHSLVEARRLIFCPAPPPPPLQSVRPGARGNNPYYSTAAENVTFVFKGSFANIRSVRVWYSNLSQEQGARNPPDSQLFQRLADLPVINNAVSLMVYPEEL